MSELNHPKVMTPLDIPWENIFLLALDAMVIADDQGRCVVANPAACTLLRRPLETLQGQSIARWFPPGTGATEMWVTFLQQGTQTGEVVLVRGDGSLCPVEFTATTHIAPHLHLSILRDISDRKTAENQIQQLNQVLERQVAEKTADLLATQATLQAQQTFLDSIVNSVDAVLWSLDPTLTQVSYISAAAERVYGYPSTAFLADASLWETCLHPEDHDWVMATLPALLQADQPSQCLEYRIIRADGAVRWLRDRSVVIRDGAGFPLRIDGVTTDITEAKSIEADLRLSILQSQAILDQLAIGINQADSTGRFLLVNPTFCHMLGYTEAELLQLSYQDITHPEDMDVSTQDLVNLQDRQVPSIEFCKRYRRKDGTYRWVNVVLSLLRDEQGEVVSDLALVMDIGDRKEAELALSQSERRHRALVEAMPDLLIRFDQEGMILDSHITNADLLYGEPHRPVGTTLADFFPPDLTALFLGHIRQTLERKSLQTFEYDLPIQGEIHHFEGRVTPCAPDQVLYISRDITDRKTMELALRDSEQRFQAIFNQMYQFIGLLTPAGILLEANQTALDFVGAERESLVNRPFWEICEWGADPQRRHQVQRAIAAAAQGRFIRFPVTLQGQGFQAITIDFSLRPVRDKHGQVVLIIPEGRDITHRLQVEAELRRTRTFLEQTNTLARVGGWIVEMATQEVFLTKVAREIFGLSPRQSLTLGNILARYRVGTSRDTMAEVLATCVHQQQPWDVTVELVIGEDQYRWVRVRGQGEFQGKTCVRLYGSMQDVDDLMRARLAMHTLTEQLQQAQRVARMGNWWIDPQTQQLQWSAEMYNLLGQPPEAGPLLLEDSPDLLHPEDYPRWLNHLRRIQGQVEPQTIELRIHHPNGTLRYLRITTYGSTHQGQAIAPLGTLVDITEQKVVEARQTELYTQLQAANRELHRLATVDGLTQVANRRQFDHCLTQAWQEAQHHQSPLSLLLCDIDFFKPYNDHYGHPAGDACLQQVAIALKEAVCRPQDVIARYGGEEFAILLPHTDLSGAITIAQRIQATITRYQLPHQFSGVASHITLSIGIGCCPRVSPHRNPEDLVSVADQGLYSAKAQGRDRYCIGPTP